MTLYWRRGLAAGVLLCLVIWVLCGSPATPLIAGVPSEPIVLVAAASAFIWLWIGSGGS